MYKKIILLSALLCTVTQHAFDAHPWLEIRPSYFFFYSHPMNHVYKKGGLEIQGTVSFSLWDYLDLYGSVGCRQLWGHALNSCEKTRLTVVPIDIGLKPLFNFKERYFYFFAIGPRYFHFHQHNSSPYLDCTVNGNGIGLFLNTGFNLLLKEHLLLGIFGEYSYEKKKICPKKPNVFSNGPAQIGGLAFGLSVGYAF